MTSESQFEPFEFGEYRLLRKIAIGGMSEIFLAQPLDPARHSERYVVKRLAPEIAHTSDFIEMFQTEARVATKLRHPNIVRIYDCGVTRGQCYMVMEYVEGLDCWKITRRLARLVETLPLPQVVLVLSGVLRALGYLHGLADEGGRPLGIVHRDVSPSNIYVSRRGDVKLGDFGIALLPGKEAQTERRTRLRGKIRYLSPEQVQGKPFDHRSDLFAVGVLLAELIIGRSPFRGQTDIAVLLNIRDVKLHLAEDLDDRTPPGLREILLRAMAREPEDRYSGAAPMLADLEAFASSEGPAAGPADLAATVERLLRPGDVGDQPTRLDGTPTPSALAPIGPRESRVSFDDLTPIRLVYEYRVHAAAGGAPEGPFNYGEMVERILNGVLRPDDRVSANHGPFVALSSLSDLAQHLPVLTPVTKRVDQPGLPDRRGLLQDEPVGRVFAKLSAARETGLVVFDCDATRKEVYLSEGSPVYASSNVHGELLGEYLVSKGVISRMELEMALAVLPKYQGHIGDTLVALELVDPLTLFEHITEQVRRKILDLFHWKRGEWSFYRGVLCEKRAFPLATTGTALIHEGIRQALTDAAVEEWWTSVKPSALTPVRRPEPPAAEWPLGDAERRVLALVDRRIDAEEAMRIALAGTPLDRAAIIRAAAVCVAAGLIDVEK